MPRRRQHSNTPTHPLLPLSSPSSSTEKPESKEHQDYVDAEKLGLDSCDAAVCRYHYPDCRKSVMDVFTSFENPFETLFNTYL